MPAPKTDVKPGIRTTEFWGKVAAQVGLAATGFSQVLPGVWAAALIVAAEAAYGISRGLSKLNQ